MSKYTTEVRFICETSAGLSESVGYKSINTILDECIDKVFDFDFPIFDELYRPVLEKKILKHYYTREIATETVGLWKHFLDMKLNEIMPFYNKLYNSELLSFNPFYDVDLTRDHNRTGETESAGTSENVRTDDLLRSSEDGGTQSDSGSNVPKNTRWDIYSDTPQGALTGVINENYLTNARKITDDGTGSTHSNTTTFGKTNETSDTGTVTNEGSTTENIQSTEDYLEHVKGKTAGISYSKMLNEYRETFLNIDMMIIDDLKELFFGLW